MNKCCCIYCGEEKSVKGIHTHVERAHLKSKKYSSGNHGKYKEVSNKILESYNKNPNYCNECKCKLPHSKKNNKFCSNRCAAIFNNRQKDYSKIKTGPEGKPKYSKIEWLVCQETGRYYCNRNSKGYTRKRSPYISDKKRKQYKGNKKLYDYRQKCLFKFNVYDYPDKFDLALVENYGWYSPSNKGNNLSGVSRDHMISVKYGFENNIDQDVISHPANCKLMIHNKNSSKCAECSLTIEELLERIKNW